MILNFAGVSGDHAQCSQQNDSLLAIGHGSGSSRLFICSERSAPPRLGIQWLRLRLTPKLMAGIRLEADMAYLNHCMFDIQ